MDRGLVDANVGLPETLVGLDRSQGGGRLGEDGATVEGFVWRLGGGDDDHHLNPLLRGNGPSRNTTFASLLMRLGFTTGMVVTVREFWLRLKTAAVRVMSKCLKLLKLDPILALWRFFKRHPLTRNFLSPYVAVTALAFAAYVHHSNGKKQHSRRKCSRVAVVGSGIAGTGAAWSLHKAGIDVVLYEKKPRLGGNAKSYKWNVDGKQVETSLAVFAWPDKYFHSYNCLIDELGMEVADHELKFFVTEKLDDGTTRCVFAHDRANWKPEPWLEQDLQRWERLASFVKGINAVVQPAPNPSIYRMSYFNPMNLIPLRTLCRVFGISDRFWDFVFVPIHTSTFLEVEMSTLPAVMAELLNELVPFTRTPIMKSWSTNAYDVIQRMTKDFPKGSCRTSCAVESVRYEKRPNSEHFDIKVLDEDGNEDVFDGIIFACSAVAMNMILHGKGAGYPGELLVANVANGLNNPGSSFAHRALNWLEGTVFSRTMYTTDRDKVFQRGIVHSHGTVVPEEFRDEVLRSYCNYIEVKRKDPKDLENSFVISSWAPSAQGPDVRGKLPMLVTYNGEEKLAHLPSEWTTTSREAHPCLTTWQMFASNMLWPILQGTRNKQTYFCGSAATPGNGHDLSFLSGLVAAAELGAPFPFAHEEKARADYERLRKMMFSFWA